MRRPKLARALLLPVLVLGVVPCAHADHACAGFSWNVEHERKLFSQNAQPLPAGLTLKTAPTLAADRLYKLQLQGQSQIRFVTSPGTSKPADWAYGGLAALTVEKGGVYRVAIDQKIWVDVVADKTILQAKDFQGRAGCDAPHKIVEFLLPPRTPIAIQLSGGGSPVVKLTITRAPDGQASEPHEPPVTLR